MKYHEYENIEIPDELSLAVIKGIEKGKQGSLENNTKRERKTRENSEKLKMQEKITFF